MAQSRCSCSIVMVTCVQNILRATGWKLIVGAMFLRLPTGTRMLGVLVAALEMRGRAKMSLAATIPGHRRPLAAKSLWMLLVPGQTPLAG